MTISRDQGKLDPIHNGTRTQPFQPDTFMESREVNMMALYDTGAATCVVCDDPMGLRLRDEEREAVLMDFEYYPLPQVLSSGGTFLALFIMNVLTVD